MPKKVAKPVKEPEFSLTLLVGDKTYNSSGPDLQTALQPFKDIKLGGKLWLTVKHNGHEKPFQLKAIRWRRLFLKQMDMDIFNKKVTMFLS